MAKRSEKPVQREDGTVRQSIKLPKGMTHPSTSDCDFVYEEYERNFAIAMANYKRHYRRPNPHCREVIWVLLQLGWTPPGIPPGLPPEGEDPFDTSEKLKKPHKVHGKYLTPSPSHVFESED